MSKDDNYIVLWLFEYRLMWPRDLYPTCKIIYPKYHSNPNLTAQKGVFTLWQNTYKELNNNSNILPFNELFDNNYLKIDERELLYKIYINVKEIDKIYKYLIHYGYTSSSLFPGFYGVAQSINDITNLTTFMLKY